MKRLSLIACTVLPVLAMGLSAANAAEAIPRLSFPAGVELGIKGDDGSKSNPLAAKRRTLRQSALEAILKGKVSGKGKGKAYGKVAEVARGQYAELSREDEDLVWTVLAEFGDLDSPVGILQGGLPGPKRNQIPEPDRNFDNSTIWSEDFNREYYEDLLFSEAPGALSLRNFYIEQSSGRYAVDGDVSDWVQVPFRAAHYGRDWCGDNVCASTWWFIADSVNAWYDAQLAAGKTPAEIDAYLSRFDMWDRYDYDGDGNFDEPDGYIDHFQSVHAGIGQESEGGAYGDDAIWSHRWYVQLTPIGAGGPTLEDGTVLPLGGVQVGLSRYWIGDYTIEPENGGVGVFAHEFGHDLGLPDLYNTEGGSCHPECENSTGYWTLMGSGGWLNKGTVDIGSAPGHLGAWEKLQLGWLNYELAVAGQQSEHKLGPAETHTKQAQGLIVALPDKEVVSQIGHAYAGDYFYYSGAGNDLDQIMYRSFTLGTGASMTARVSYDIELDWDYAYLVVSTDGGASWASVQTNRSTTDDPNVQNFGFGITGSSGGWVELSADLSAYTGDILLGFRYWTDTYVVNPGFMVDEIAITGYPRDGAEADAGWSLNGFKVTNGTESSFHFNAYLAEFRQYRGFDDGLRTGPYNFGFDGDPELHNYVERYSYQDGLLITYWDTSQLDNSTSVHPGRGLILPVDAHPATMYRADGGVWRGRVQSYDSTFGLEPTEPLSLRWEGWSSDHASQPAVPVFDDSIQHWNPETPTAGVINPITGTQIRVKSVSALGSFMQVEVKPAR